MQLRPYQEQALEAVVKNLKAGTRHQLLVLATGLGKSCIAANLPKTLKDVLPGKLLFIAHTDELCAQAVDKMRVWNPNLKIGLEKAGSYADQDCDIIVSCNASIGRTGSTRMAHFWDDISVIIADEAHRILGTSWINILDDSGVLRPESNKLLIGLTATPRRRNRIVQKDGVYTLDNEEVLSLKSVFKKIVYSFPIRKGIKEGFLSPLRGIRVNTKVDLDDVKIMAGDFAVDQLSNAVNTLERNLAIVKAWKENAKDRQTLVFTTDVQHAKDLADVFLHNGVMAQPIFGSDPKRTEKLSWFESGKINVLCNCALLTEGFDSPNVSCIVLARPTRNGSFYTQMIGRGTRIFPGKKDCLVVDMCDNSRKCSLITLPSLLGLNPDMDLHGQDVVQAAEQMEALQEQYPGVNFTNLVDLSKVKAYIESIDIFAAPYAEEVKEFSTLAWMATNDGEYVLPIPEKKDLADAAKYNKKVFARYLHEKLHLRQNELDEWELSLTSTTVGERKLGTFNDLKEAFEVADDVIQRNRFDRVKLMLRESPQGEHSATEAQKRFLRKLSKKRPILYCLCEVAGNPGEICPACRKKKGITSGMASLAINKLQHVK